jgi:hypothetical protein
MTDATPDKAITIEQNDAPDMLRRAMAALTETLRAEHHLPGGREQHRQQLAQVIATAEAIVTACAEGGEDRRTLGKARLALIRAYAARALDARHGVGQLSQGSQRAPTREACDDGWERVAEVAEVAEAAANAAGRLAETLNSTAGWKGARAAEAAAQETRRIISARNHAYVFHADPSFSFGEGWYVAAAAALDDITVQVEPDEAQSNQAERFLEDAGLGQQVLPYRPRPRANKHLPEIVASAFRADPEAAQQRLRAAFLGDEEPARAVVNWCDETLATAPITPKVLLWLRYAAYQADRNTSYAELVTLCERARVAGLAPILIGDALQGGALPAGAADMTLFFKGPAFQGPTMRRAQLQLFEHLKAAHGLVGQVGVTTAGMDGPALMGLPTMYLTQEPNVRLGRWVGAIPGYEEIVREEGYLERISATFEQWVGE